MAHNSPVLSNTTSHDHAFQAWTGLVESLPHESDTSPISQSSNDERPRDTATNTRAIDHAVQDTFAQLLSRLSNQLVPIVEDAADTLIYLGTPPQLPDQLDYEHEYIVQQFERPYLMRSSTLRALSSSKFDKFLGPMSARTERRLKKLGVHKFVSNLDTIKYYIDLSPAINDDEALIQITELTAPQGALSWHLHAADFGVSVSHVCGKDRLEIPPKASFNTQIARESRLGSVDFEMPDQLEGQSEAAVKLTDIPDEKQKSLYDLPLEEEYSSLRHHVAIARLLHAIVGNDPRLNSAPKAWTFCMLANYLGCAQSPRVNTWVTSWLLQEGNINFVQMNPDIAYRMAMSMQSVWLLRCTFTIMVGQQAALEGAVDGQASPLTSNRTAHHVASCLDDDEINRIDHAASTLIRRVKSALLNVTSHPGVWHFEGVFGSEMAKLNNIDLVDSEIQGVHETVIQHLKSYFQRMMLMTLSDAYDLSGKGPSPQRLCDVPEIYAQSPPSVKILCRFFWENLRHEEYTRDYVDSNKNREIWDRTLLHLQQQDFVPDNDIAYVSKQQCLDVIRELNKLVQHLIHMEESDAHSKAISAVTSRIKQEQQTQRYRDFMALQPNSPAKKRKTSEDTPSTPSSYRFDKDELLATRDDSEEKKHMDRSWNAGTFAEAHANDGKSITERDPYRASSTGEGTHLQTARLSDQEHALSLRFDQSILASATPSLQVSLQGLPFRQKQPPRSQPVIPDTHQLIPVGTIEQRREMSSDTISHAYTNDSALDDGDAEPSTFSISSKRAHTSDDFSSIPQDNDTLAATTRNVIDPNKPLGLDHSYDTRHRTIDGMTLLGSISRHIKTRLEPMVTPGYVTDGTCDFDIPVNRIPTLLCLTEDEYKYLPMWAGGLDDGSGGVFDDGMEVPDAPDTAEGGFRGGAIGIIPGIGSSLGGSMAGSEFEDIGTDVGISTVGKASRYATDGTATETVISLDD